MGPIGSYNSICLTGFGLLFVPLLQSSLWPGLIQLLTGTPGWTMDQVHCLPFQGLPKLPVTRSWSYLHRKSNTLWDMLKFFFQSKGSASLIQGLKEKVNSSISLFKGWFGCLSTRQGSSVGMWCGKTHRADSNLLLTVQGGVHNAALRTVLMNYPFISRWALLACYLGGG